MKRHEVRARIEEAGILPCVRVTSREMARFAAEAVYSSGIPVVEITLTTPGALEVIDDLAKRYRSSRQGCESSKVKVLAPSITWFGRLAYPVHAEVTKHVLPGRKSLGCPASMQR